MRDAQIFSCASRDLQEAISNEFPSYPYFGQVLAVSQDPSVYDVEDDNLDTFLKGKSWRDLDPPYVELNYDEYVLMSEQATPAFLGAWLWMAAENPELPNRVMSSLIFHLATFGRSRVSGLWAQGFKGLNQKQRDVIALLLHCAAKYAADSEDGEQIEKAIASVEINRCPQ